MARLASKMFEGCLLNVRRLFDRCSLVVRPMFNVCFVCVLFDRRAIVVRHARDVGATGSASVALRTGCHPATALRSLTPRVTFSCLASIIVGPLYQHWRKSQIQKEPPPRTLEHGERISTTAVAQRIAGYRIPPTSGQKPWGVPPGGASTNKHRATNQSTSPSILFILSKMNCRSIQQSILLLVLACVAERRATLVHSASTSTGKASGTQTGLPGLAREPRPPVGWLPNTSVRVTRSPAS